MTWAKRCNRIVPLLVTALLAASCAVQLVAPANPDLLQKASAMQAEVATWDLKMRAGAGTITDDPRNPDVSAAIDKWHGEAEAMLTSAVSNDPRASNCSATVNALTGAIQSAIPADLRPAVQSVGSSGQSSNTGCEAGVVEHLQTGIADIEKALKYCQLSWIPDSFFSKPGAAAPNAPDEKTQQQRQTSCLSEFKVDSNVPAAAASAQHGRAVSVLLTTLQSIVYVETRKKAAEAAK